MSFIKILKVHVDKMLNRGGGKNNLSTEEEGKGALTQVDLEMEGWIGAIIKEGMGLIT